MRSQSFKIISSRMLLITLFAMFLPFGNLLARSGRNNSSQRSGTDGALARQGNQTNKKTITFKGVHSGPAGQWYKKDGVIFVTPNNMAFNFRSTGEGNKYGILESRVSFLVQGIPYDPLPQGEIYVYFVDPSTGKPKNARNVSFEMYSFQETEITVYDVAQDDSGIKLLKPIAREVIPATHALGGIYELERIGITTTIPIKGFSIKVKEYSIAGSYGISNLSFELVSEIKVQLRAFIPCEGVTLGGAGMRAGGIYRGDGYSGKTQRAIQIAKVTFAINGPKLVEEPEVDWGASSRYSFLDGELIKGSGWCCRLKPGAKPNEVKKLPVTAQNNVVIFDKLSDTQARLTFILEGGNPVSQGSELFTPRLSSKITVYLRQEKGEEPQYLISGRHDGFPAYEIKINDKKVYCYDPLVSGANPFALGTPKERRVDTDDWQDLSSTKPKQFLYCADGR